MDHNHKCDHTKCTTANASVVQTLSEMDWERGLWCAAFSGDVERVKFLIRKARDTKELVNTPDNSGYAPLHYAARNGHAEVCNILLHNGADIDVLTKSGKATPLHKAAAAGKTETVLFLIKSGACVYAQDIDGQTILHKAAENKHHRLVNILLGQYPQLAHMKTVKGHVGVTTTISVVALVHPSQDDPRRSIHSNTWIDWCNRNFRSTMTKPFEHDLVLW